MKILSALSSLFSIIAGWFKASERADTERTGAIKQREADAQEELRKTREQMKDAADNRPGDGRRALAERRF